MAALDAAPGADGLATMLRSWTPHVTVVGAEAVAALTGDGSDLAQWVTDASRQIGQRGGRLRSRGVVFHGAQDTSDDDRRR